MEPQFIYNADVTRVIDGDTLDLDVDLGFKVHVRVRVRLFGIDTPETYGVKKESEEFKAGTEAKAFVLDWLDLQAGESCAPRAPVVIKSHDGKPIGQGKYGRWLVEVFPDAGGSLNEELVRMGHAEVVKY